MNDQTNRILFEEFKNDEISYVYLGKFDNVVLGMATQLIKTSQNEETEGKKNKLSFLITESFQNILRYGLPSRGDEYENGEIFIVRKLADSYYITSGNYVENSKIEKMKEKLERVNSLSSDDLKKLYVEILTNKKLSKEGGAGLGFIEMVRKTKEKLEFDFVKLDEKHSFFYIQLRFKNNDKDDSLPLINIEKAKLIKEAMEKGGRYIAMQGDFCASAINPVLQIAESNLESNQNLAIQRKTYHTMVEILQNIARHSQQNEKGCHIGLFSMGYINNNYIISASNYIEQQKISKLDNYINKLNNKTKDQLDDYYKHILRNGHEDQTIFSGLGLIDIARTSATKIQYDFADCENNKKLFSISAKI